MIRVGRFEIAEGVLDHLPESVARENQALLVACADRRGHLLLPAEPPPHEETLAKLQFILNLDLTHEAVDAAWLAEAIDQVYSLQSIAVTECALPFALRCTQQWLNLTPTEAPRQRFCEQCQRRVFLTHSESEAVELARRGECVAFGELPGPVESVGSMGIVDVSALDPELQKRLDQLRPDL